MTYLVCTYDLEEGWYVSKESENLDDFDQYDKAMFDIFLRANDEDFLLQEGNTMWTIEGLFTNKEKKQ